jgi:hypothetical protein
MKLTKSITVFLLLLATPSLTLAQTTTVYSYQSGNFNAQNIWTYTNGGVDFVTVPLDPDLELCHQSGTHDYADG